MAAESIRVRGCDDARKLRGGFARRWVPGLESSAAEQTVGDNRSFVDVVRLMVVDCTSCLVASSLGSMVLCLDEHHRWVMQLFSPSLIHSLATAFEPTLEVETEYS